MPAHDSYWLLERLGTAGAPPGATDSAVPAIAVIALSDEHPSAQARGRGFTVYLPKPIIRPSCAAA